MQTLAMWGGAPDKINLYVGKKCVKYNVPAAESLDRLIDLIKQQWEVGRTKLRNNYFRHFLSIFIRKFL